MSLRQVISGAQIGADIAGLRAAHAEGFTTGGFMPAGRRTRNGPLPLSEFRKYGLVEVGSGAYPVRTEKNVVSSDGTICFAHTWHSPGERLTKRLLRKHGKPSFGITLVWLQGRWRIECGTPWSSLTFTEEMYRIVTKSYAKHVAHWVRNREIEVLNIAGNGDESIEECVQHFLLMVFRELRDMSQGDSLEQGGEEPTEGVD